MQSDCCIPLIENIGFKNGGTFDCMYLCRFLQGSADFHLIYLFKTFQKIRQHKSELGITASAIDYISITNKRGTRCIELYTHSIL
jgi:hypothetical protein